MLGTVGLELSNFINPELTWKTVSKANRTASRRTKKPVARSLKVGVELADRSPKRVEDSSASESEKLGVAVLGRRFAEKLEHVPIKKRRFLLRSPSPPPRNPSPRPEESEQLVDNQCASGQRSCPSSVSNQHDRAVDASIAIKFNKGVDDGVVDGRIPEVTDEKLGYSEDFSGIAILAAAACNNSIGDDVDNAKEGPVVEKYLTQEGDDSSTSAVPLKETISSLETATCFRKDLIHENNMEGSISQDNSVAVLHNNCSNKDDGTVKRSVSLQDDRLQWDLNTVMDAWLQPCDDPVVDSQTNVLEGITEDGMLGKKQENLEGGEIQRDPGDSKYHMESTVQSAVGGVVSADAYRNQMLPDSRGLAPGTYELNREENKLEACASSDRTGYQKNCVPTPTEHAPEPSKFSVTDAKASTQVFSMDACVDHSPGHRSDHVTSTWVPDKNRNTTPASVTVEHNGEECSSAMQFGKTVCLQNVQIEKHDVTFPHAPVSEKATCEINAVLNDGCEDSGRTSGLHDNRISPRKMMSTDTCQPLGPDPFAVENPVSKSDELGASHPSPKCEDFFASGAFVGEGQPVVTVDAKGQDDKASAADTTEVDSLVHIVPKEFMYKSSGNSASTLGAQGGFNSYDAFKSRGDDPASHTDKVALEDPFDGNYDSDVSQDDQGRIVGMENMTEFQAGYDSQFEDGELRESVVHCWEENEGEDEEAERVDYESDNRDTDDFDAADYSVSMSGKVEAGAKCDSERFCGSDHFGSDSDKIIMEKAMRESSCQPCPGGLLATNAMEVEFSKRGSVKSSKMQLRTQFTIKDDIEKSDMDMKVDRVLSAGSDTVIDNCAREDALKELSHTASLKTKFSGWDQLAGGREISADMAVEVNGGGTRKNHTSDCLIGIDVKDFPSRAVGSASRRELLSRIEGPSSSDVLHRKDTELPQWSRSNNLDDFYSRAERETGFDKSMGRGRSALHVPGRSQGSGGWVDPSVGYWDSQRHHSPNYCGSYDSRRPRPKSVITNNAAKVESSGFVIASDRTFLKAEVTGFDSRVRRQNINPSPNGVHRPFIRRRLLADRDDAYGTHMGILPVRDISRNRSWGRSGRYPQGVSRGPREGYHGPVPGDTAESSVRLPHHLARRERSFSPIPSRGAPHFSRPHETSRSRSRTRSPPTWFLPRERNTGSRHLSRSPDFRSEARMERVRLPFQKPDFAADYELGFMSPPRNRISPEHNSRWIDDRNCVIDHFRARRSPARMFRQSQRFDSVNSAGRLRSDDHFRPMIRPGRFPEMAGAGRGRKYEGSGDVRRKHDNRYEMINPVRRYDEDGVVRRFRYDVEDCFAAPNSLNKDGCIRGTDRRPRDDPRRASEDRGHLRYNHDRMYNSGPKSSGMLREYDEDASPRRQRPS